MRIFSEYNMQGKDFKESDAILLLRSVSPSNDSLYWYWSSDATGYTSIFNQEPSSVWFLTLPSSEEKDESTPLYGTSIRLGRERTTTKLMPFFYTNPAAPTSLLISQGVNTSVQGDDQKVEIAALCETTICRVYQSKASTGRCFCCQYIVNLHDKISGKSTPEEQLFQKLKLEKKFQQKMSKKSPTHDAPT
jgi:hypothetical protein